jgi:type III secretion protein R
MVILGLLPFMVMMVTSYAKIVVVTTLVRNALGVQQIPPAMVMNGIAIILTIFVMAPVVSQSYQLVNQLKLSPKPQPTELFEAAISALPPLEAFLSRNTDHHIRRHFIMAAQRIWPAELSKNLGDNSFLILIPSFVITELTEAFKIGFLLYLPFIAIDLIISNILLAMGMMMVSPMTISLPFKLLLFVTLEGWLKICQGLMYSYA